MIQKERVVSTRSNQDIEKLINKLTQGKGFTIKNWKEKRDFNANSGSFDDLANLVSTLIEDLKKKGIISG